MLPRTSPVAIPVLVLALALGLLAARPARAHTPSETFLTVFVQSGSITGHWDVAERDLVQGVGLTPEQAAGLRAEELDRRLEALALDVVAALEIRADGRKLSLRPTDYLPIRLRDLDYVRVPFEDTTPRPGTPAVLSVHAAALFRVDTNIHGLLRVEHNGRSLAASFNAREFTRVFTLGAEGGGEGNPAWTFVKEGMRHIWQGFDHLLFLISLLLPAVLRREDGRWTGADSFRPAFLQVVRMVTAFTVAHSLTLTLAVFGVVNLPPRVVEPIIAASVVAAAVNNLWPWFGERGWMVALGFGFIHGFGFAGALLDLGLSRSSLATALVSFNVGVELGQLAIVTAFLPLAFGWRHSVFYRNGVLRAGSAVVAALAAVWMAERALGYPDFTAFRAIVRALGGA